MGVDKSTKSDNHLECSQCQQCFQSEEDRERHLLREHWDFNSVEEAHVKVEEIYKCTTCAKHFDNHLTLQLHLQWHKENTASEIKSVQQSNVDSNEHSQVGLLGKIKSEHKTIQTSKEQLLVQSSAAARRVGLTKIRLEDCFRCDACSCIYLEEEDYHKHMKNFHRDPFKKRKQKKMCRSCCKNCNCKRECGHLCGTRATNSNNLHCDIKDRWRRIVTMQVSSTKTLPTIKPEPELDTSEDLLDYSHLLSQVEVRIKTEPDEDNKEIQKSQTLLS